MSMSSASLMQVDWSRLPAPEDDGAAAHLAGAPLPAVALEATDGTTVRLSELRGRTVLYVYPLTGRPDRALPGGWEDIPGARGCTPQACAFRDHFSQLRQAGVANVFGLSVQDAAYQREAADRLHLPFALLSDAKYEFASGMRLPTFDVAGITLLRRLTMIIEDRRVMKVFYPVFPPDQNAADVLRWLRDNHPA